MEGFLHQQIEAQQLANRTAEISLAASSLLEDAASVRDPGEASLYLARTDALLGMAGTLIDELKVWTDRCDPPPGASDRFEKKRDARAAIAAQQFAALLQTVNRLKALRTSLLSLSRADDASAEADRGVLLSELEAGLAEARRTGDAALSGRQTELLEHLKASLDASGGQDDTSDNKDSLLARLAAGLAAERRHHEP